MTEVVVFADAEAAAVSYLAPALAARGDTATVATRFREGRHVRVSRVGGVSPNLITDSAMLLFECYDVAEMDASSLARLARGLIWAVPGQTVDGTFIRRCVEVGGPQFYPDPDTTLPRYQFTAQLDIRGEVL